MIRPEFFASLAQRVIILEDSFTKNNFFVLYYVPKAAESGHTDNR